MEYYALGLTVITLFILFVIVWVGGADAYWGLVGIFLCTSIIFLIGSLIYLVFFKILTTLTGG